MERRKFRAEVSGLMMVAVREAEVTEREAVAAKLRELGYEPSIFAGNEHPPATVDLILDIAGPDDTDISIRWQDNGVEVYCPQYEIRERADFAMHLDKTNADVIVGTVTNVLEQIPAE